MNEQHEARVLERIGNDLKSHVVTTRLSSGLHRHWRCQKPGSWNMGFDIVTWPGSLCFTGDMGDYLFQRTADMVVFMRGSCMSYSYAAEKCVAHDGRLKEWSEDVFNQALRDRVKDSEGDDGKFTVYRHGGKVLEDVQDAINKIKAAHNEYGTRWDAERAMHESGLWDEIPSCEVYTFHFLWALHALKWFCAKVDNASTEAALPCS